MFRRFASGVPILSSYGIMDRENKSPSSTKTTSSSCCSSYYCPSVESSSSGCGCISSSSSLLMITSKRHFFSQRIYSRSHTTTNDDEEEGTNEAARAVRSTRWVLRNSLKFLLVSGVAFAGVKEVFSPSSSPYFDDIATNPSFILEETPTTTTTTEHQIEEEGSSSPWLNTASERIVDLYHSIIPSSAEEIWSKLSSSEPDPELDPRFWWKKPDRVFPSTWNEVEYYCITLPQIWLSRLKTTTTILLDSATGAFFKKESEQPKLTSMMNTQQRFHQAIHDGDMTTIKAILNELQYDRQRSTTDTESSGAKNKEVHRQVIMSLLTGYSGTTKSSVDGGGRTPLHIAVERGHDEVVKLLCRVLPEEELEVLDGAGHTPFTLACKHGHLSTAQLLLLYGASERTQEGGKIDASSIQRAGVESPPPLSVAARYGQVEILRFLLSDKKFEEGKIDIHRQNSKGVPPLIEASARKHFDAVELIMTEARKLYDKKENLVEPPEFDLLNTEVTSEGLTALQLAVLHKDYEAVTALVSLGARVDGRKANGEPPAWTLDRRFNRPKHACPLTLALQQQDFDMMRHLRSCALQHRGRTK